MIDVHLIGYTADLEHLVLDLDGDAGGRYRLVIDADLLATLHEIRERRLAAGQAWAGDELFVGDDEWDDEAWDDEEEPEDVDDDGDEAPDDEPADEELDDEPGEGEAAGKLVDLTGLDDADDLDLFDDDGLDDDLALDGGETRGAEPAPPGPVPAADPDPDPESESAGVAAEATPPAPVTGDDETQVALPRKEAATAGVDAKLSPAQIQALLRAGRTPRTVAKRAGTDEAWIERWLPPILEERARMLREARSKKLERPRLGRSRDALGEAVRKQLRDRGVPEDEPAWDTSRRADGTWRVSVKYRHRGKNRTASWRYDPREDQLSPSSDLARELGWTGKRSSRRSSSPSSAATKPVEKASPNRQPADDR